MTEQSALPVKKDHKFVKGQSGNPNGRPKGSKNAVTLQKIALEGELRKQLSYDMAAILQKAIEMAKAGDGAMIKLLIDKVISSSKIADEDAPGREKVEIVINQLPGIIEPKVVKPSVSVIEGEVS